MTCTCMYECVCIALVCAHTDTYIKYNLYNGQFNHFIALTSSLKDSICRPVSLACDKTTFTSSSRCQLSTVPQSCGKSRIFAYFPHFCENVLHFWLYFEITKIYENRYNFSCTETFCSKKLYENGNDSVTYPLKLFCIQKYVKNR